MSQFVEYYIPLDDDEEEGRQKKKKHNFSSNLVFGKIAENLMERIFVESGYDVYNFGYENRFDNLKIIQDIDKNLNNSTIDRITASEIRSSPDFLVTHSKKGIFRYVEVKAISDYMPNNINLADQTQNHQIRNIALQYLKHWPNTIIILINLNNSFIRACDLSTISKSNSMLQISPPNNIFPGFKYNEVENILAKTLSVFETQQVKRLNEMAENYQKSISELKINNSSLNTKIDDTKFMLDKAQKTLKKYKYRSFILIILLIIIPVYLFYLHPTMGTGLWDSFKHFVGF